MSTVQAIWLVTRREVGARLLTRANLISTAVMVAIIVIGSVALSVFGDDGDDTVTVAVTEQTAVLAPVVTQAGAAQGLSLQMPTQDEATARQGLTEGDVEAFVTGDPAAPEVLVTEDLDDQLAGILTAGAQQHALHEEITALGGQPEQVAAELQQAQLTVTALEQAPEFDGATYTVAMLTISLLLFGLIGSGAQISMGVVEEKTSRVVEILLATIRPAQLLAGKILGIGLVTLIQLVVIGGTAAAAATATGLTEGVSIDLGGALLWMLLWFVLGFAIFALLFGGFAALVARQEDIGSITTPLTFLLLAPFYLAFFLIPNDPEGSLVRVLSQVPFFAPFMMPVRSAFGGVAGWELAMSVGLCLLTVPLLVWVAGRVYSRAVLHTGGRLKIRQALGAG